MSEWSERTAVPRSTPLCQSDSHLAGARSEPPSRGGGAAAGNTALAIGRPHHNADRSTAFPMAAYPLSPGCR